MQTLDIKSHQDILQDAAGIIRCNRMCPKFTLAPLQRVSQSVNKPDRKRRRATLEQLEARTLFSADIMSAVLDNGHINDTTTPDDTDWLTAPTASNTQSLEIVFIDEATPDYQRLIQDIQLNHFENRHFEIVVIGEDENGIHKITETLAKHSNVDAMHLVSHGSDATVNIGNVSLDRDTVSEYEDQIVQWGQAFTEQGDLLIYGCDFSANEQGRNFGAELSALTGTDIASSDNATGNIPGRADWVLEHIHGTVETAIVFSTDLQDTYQRSLANVIDVTTTNDVVDATITNFDDLISNPGADGEISLREAILAAENQAGSDTITLAPGSYILDKQGQFEDFSATGDLDIRSSVSIIGSGSGNTILNGDIIDESIFEIHATGGLTIEGLTLEEGGTDNIRGGAIHNNGILNAQDVVLNNNSTLNPSGNGGLKGGALYNNGQATLDQVIVSNNTGGEGGAIFNDSAASLSISNSTITNNVSKNGSGGGIANTGDLSLTGVTFSDNSTTHYAGALFITGSGSATVTNSTFSANDANFGGGGIDIFGGSLSISFSTIANNDVNQTGSGLNIRSGTVTLGNSIFADNLGAQFGGQQVNGSFTSDGFNIISTTTGFSGHTSQDLIGVDPQLQPLANNGGFTETHALTIGSDAEDMGDPMTAPATDQRGEARDATPDIGAVEGSISPREPPQISTSLATNTYIENNTLIVDSGISVTDTDSVNFNGGLLTITSIGFSEPEDTITILPTGIGPGQIDVSGSVVSYEGNAIGTLSIGTGATSLQVTIDSEATSDVVTALMQGIAFSIDSNAPSTQDRTLEFVVSDGDGGTSQAETIVIEVTAINDAPAINAAPDRVLINEIHYNNGQGDVDKGIEIAAPAGTDLGGWTLSLYRSEGFVYNSVNLNGIVPDEGNGSGTIFFPASGPFRSGPGNSIALIDPAGTVVEFLSYEGTLTPDSGPAAGLTSTDIGVFEGSDTPIGYSLQRISDDNNIAWQAAAPHTYDNLNPTQILAPQSTDEDIALVFGTATANPIVISDNDTTANLTVTLSVNNGVLAFSSNLASSGSVITFTGSLNAINDELEGLSYTPNPNFNGNDVLSITVEDQDTTAPTNQSTSSSIDIEVRSVNDAPASKDKTIQTNEDQAYTFSQTDFLFLDQDGDSFSAIKISSTPVNGNLLFNGSIVSVGETIPLTSIALGELSFTPTSNLSGTALQGFDFEIVDDGGTANGGSNTDPTPNTISLDIQSVSDAPQGADNLISVTEDTPLPLTLANFGFSDPQDSTNPDQPTFVTINQAPVTGILNLNGSAVTNGTTVSTTDIIAGDLIYIPSPDSFGLAFDNLQFSVHDSGSVLNGGQNIDQIPNTLIFDINNVNDAPVGTDQTIEIFEDSPYPLQATDFGFNDPVDAPSSNFLAALTITQLPGNGTLTLDGAPVALNQVISITNVVNNELIFSPDANASGSAHSTFSFKVHDNGGTANGGMDVALNSNTLTFDVSPVNDAPVAVDSTIQLMENGSHVLTLTDFGHNDTENHAPLSINIQTVPSVGWLLLNNAQVQNGAVLSIADIAAGNVVYQSAPNSITLDFFEFSVQDDGGTANGGSDTSALPASINFDFLNVSNAPLASDNTVVIAEDSSLVFSASDFGFSDPIDLDSFQELIVNSINGDGITTLNGNLISAGSTIQIADINAGLLVFTPSANSNGTNYASIDFKVRDSGSLANGGQDTSSLTNTITINVESINDAPVGSNDTIQIFEDLPYVLQVMDFGFNDPIDAPTSDFFAALTITQLPNNGSLTLNGTAVSLDQVISITEVANGRLIFSPDADTSGNAYSNFGFKVHDNGGTTNGGLDVALLNNTLTFNVLPVNDAPVALDSNIQLLENASHILTLADFGYTDKETHAPLSINIQTVPSVGQLLLNNVQIQNSTVLSTADIAAGNVVYQSAPNSIATDLLQFSVQDEGGTANGGNDTAALPATITFDFLNVNNPPSGSDKTIVINEDSAYVISASDFGFRDPIDLNSFAALSITQPPINGSLLLNGSPVTQNQLITITDIVNGQLVFNPVANASGSTYSNFSFKVHDNGGTANGGQDKAVRDNTLTFDVLPVNDAPVAVESSITLPEDIPQTLSLMDFGFSDPDNHKLQSIAIVSLPSSGGLRLAGQSIAEGTQIDASDISQGNLIYTPNSNTNGSDSVDFIVIDDGGTSNGGQNISTSSNTLLINTLPVNDSPIGGNTEITTLEDQNYQFALSDFPFSDPLDDNSISEIIILTLPADGLLSVGSNPVTPGSSINATEIAAGLLNYSPANDSYQIQQFTFQVRDDGGTDNGGTDLDSKHHTATINILSVNDAPIATDNTVNVDEDTAYLFSTSDFGFTDLESDPFQSVNIQELPTAGTLSLDGREITPGQSISIADIENELLAYVSAADQYGMAYDNFQFTVSDAGGNNNGGFDTSVIANSITINVSPVNDPPDGTDKTIQISEGQQHSFNVEDFGFTDLKDNHNFSAIIVQSSHTNGTLTLDGQAVNAGSIINVADIDAGLLTYNPITPDIDHQIEFRVKDDGPAAVNIIDLTTNTIRFDIQPVNNAPELINEELVVDEGSTTIITTAVLAATDTDDSPAELQFIMNKMPANGILTLDGIPLLSSNAFTVQDLIDNRINYIHDGSETESDFFDFTLQDGGEDGVMPIDGRFLLRIDEVIDPIADIPDGEIRVPIAGTFDSSMGDVLATGSNTLLDETTLGDGQYQIEISTLPSFGIVQLNDDGTFIYTHDGSENLDDFFVYTVTNHDGSSVSAKLSVTAEPVIASALNNPFDEIPVTSSSVNDTFSQEPLTETTIDEVVQSQESEEPDEISENNASPASGPLSETPSFVTNNTTVFVETRQEEVTSAATTDVFDDHETLLLLERGNLQSIDVRRHNEIESINFTDQTANFRVTSIDLTINEVSSATESVSSRHFLEGLSRASKELESSQQDSRRQYELGGDVAVSISFSTTAGILAWMLRGGALFGSLMAATPLWTSIDPMRITDVNKNDENEEKDNVEKIFE